MAALYEIDAEEAEEELESDMRADEEERTLQLARSSSEDEAGAHPHDVMVVAHLEDADLPETHDTAHASRISMEAAAAEAAPPASPLLGGAGGTPPPPSWVSRLTTPAAANGRDAGLDGTRAGGAL